MPASDDIQINSSLPERIAADIRRKILSGFWVPGAAIPTRRELATTYRVALRTIEQAMGPLVRDGIVEARGSRGTFVASKVASPLDTVETTSQSPISIGIIGVWSGVYGEHVVETIGLRAMEREASSHANVSLHYFNRYVGRDQLPISLVEAAQKLLSEGVDGFIVFAPEDTEFLGIAEAAKAPVVTFNRLHASVHIHQVIYDDIYAGFVAARHLMNRDWLSLVFLAPFNAFWIADRIEGSRQAAHVQGAELTVVPVPELRVPFSRYGQYREEGYRLGRSLLLSMTEPIGIIACNDMVAYGVFDAAAELDLHAGKDFAIIGFDDYVHSRRYGLSSVRPPLDQIGAECVDIVLRAVGGERCPLVVTLKSEVVARTSTTRPRQTRQVRLTEAYEKELVK